MIHIDYDLAISEQGTVKFLADQFIQKGTVVYSPSTGYSSENHISEEQYDTLSEAYRKVLERWGQPDSDGEGWNLNLDLKQCINPSDGANLIENSDKQLVAVRDIRIGEELTRSH